MAQGPINMGHVLSMHAKFKRAHAEAEAKEERRAGEFGVVHVHQHPEFKPRTGNLQKQTEFQVMRLKSGAIIRFVNKAKYASAIDGGAQPHLIRPRRADALRFIGRGGAVVYTQLVRHPGNKPYKFLYRATNAAGRVFESSMRAQMEQIASKF